MKSFIYRYILYLTVVPFISCNSDLRIEGTYDFADSNDPMKSIIISEADQTGFVSIYYVMESPYSSNAEQIIFAQDIIGEFKCTVFPIQMYKKDVFSGYQKAFEDRLTTV